LVKDGDFFAKVEAEGRVVGVEVGVGVEAEVVAAAAAAATLTASAARAGAAVALEALVERSGPIEVLSK
jgi:hypothetical protein